MILTGAMTAVQGEADKRREVTGQQAAEEVGKYVTRLSAHDWALAELPFDFEFEMLYTTLMEWRGVVQDRKARSAEWQAEALRKGDPLPALMQRDISEVEWDVAVSRAKADKACGVDETRNEHMTKLDMVNRREYLFPALGDVYENGEVESWKVRAVSFLDKASTEDARKLEEKRGVSLLSCVAKTFRQALALRLRLVMKARLQDTQGMKHAEGTMHNTLILTQKVGERLEEGKKTFACFVDLTKAFDTVKRKLLWSRLRSQGICGRLLQGLREGYHGRKSVGKCGGYFSAEHSDEGLGVTQGGVDSADLFACLIDSLDDEIRASAPGSWLGIPLRGTEGGDVDRLAVLKHADDTVLLAEDEESLRMAVEALERWCRKWQVAPNPKKCEVIVFEHAGSAQPNIVLGGRRLDVKTEVTYLGYVLTKRGEWKAHVGRRAAKAERWDGIARRLVGATGGCTVESAAQVRASAADASVLYGCELWAGADRASERRVDKHQAAVGRALLGVRMSAEACGVLTELGWQALSCKARVRRLQLWWRVGQTRSWLLQQIERQACSDEHRGPRKRESVYNWWRVTGVEVRKLECMSGMSRVELRQMSKERFKWHAQRTLWHEEWATRVQWMSQHSRLKRMARELQEEAERSPVAHAKCDKWRPARYLSAVGGHYHVRLLAMVRLDLLPVEMETGRWKGVPREARVCGACGATQGDVRHLVTGCPVLHLPVRGEHGAACWKFLLGRHNADEGRWRRVARHVEQRWRIMCAARQRRGLTPEAPPQYPCFGAGFGRRAAERGAECGRRAVERGAAGVAVGGASAVARRPRNGNRKRPFLPTLPTIVEDRDEALRPDFTPGFPIFGGRAAERGAAGVAGGGASAVARRPRNVKRKRPFLPTLPTIFEDSDEALTQASSVERFSPATAKRCANREPPRA